MNIRTIFFFILAAFMLMGAGCARKNINSTPPAKTAAVKKKAPAPSKPAKVLEKNIPAEPENAVPTEKRKNELQPLAVTGSGLLYIQVGAFADRLKAKGVLTDLISDGYKGSRLYEVNRDEFVRVQAGVFPDKETALRALKKLMGRFPESFITEGQ